MRWRGTGTAGCPPPRRTGPPIYHEARLHGGHECQLAPIPHAELLQRPRAQPAGGRKEEVRPARARRNGARRGRGSRGRPRGHSRTSHPHPFAGPSQAWDRALRGAGMEMQGGRLLGGCPAGGPLGSDTSRGAIPSYPTPLGGALGEAQDPRGGSSLPPFPAGRQRVPGWPLWGLELGPRLLQGPASQAGRAGHPHTPSHPSLPSPAGAGPAAADKGDPPPPRPSPGPLRWGRTLRVPGEGRGPGWRRFKCRGEGRRRGPLERWREQRGAERLRRAGAGC